MSKNEVSQTAENFSEQIIATLRKVCGSGPKALHEPCFSGNEWEYVKACLDSTFVSSVGEYVDRFERDLADFTGAKHAIAVVNGTAALHVALLLAGVQPGDEVLVPALTFIATANAVHYCGAVPHFVDSSGQTLGIDPEALRDWLRHISELHNGVCINKGTNRPIRVLLPMHTFGHPCDIDALQAIAHDYRLVLVEDAAESLGSLYQGQHSGTFGRLGILSFNGNKIVTTGGGGAILTNDSELGRKVKHVTTTAKKPHRWIYEHDEVGFNYRLPNINAALGCAQLEKLADFVASKRRLFIRYREEFRSVSRVSLMEEPGNCQSNYWLQALLLDESVSDQRDTILQLTNDAGLMTRPVWALLHRLTPYCNCPRAPLPVSESLERRLINIPSSAGLA